MLNKAREVAYAYCKRIGKSSCRSSKIEVSNNKEEDEDAAAIA